MSSSTINRGVGTFVRRGAVLGGLLAVFAPAQASDLSERFPNLKMSPILAAADVPQEESKADLPGHRGFATIVEEAKREALGLSAIGRSSVTSGMAVASAASDRTAASFASHAKPHCRSRSNACPPQKTPARGEAQDTPPFGIVPVPGEAVQAEAANPPAVPDLQRDLPRLARADVGGLRETWADIPNLVGDGCGPQGAVGQIPVGRLCIIAPGLSTAGSSSSPATLNLMTDPAYNTVQGIQGAGYPAMTLPSQALGNVPGTPPTNLSLGAPSGGIAAVGQPPSTFTAAAQNAFQTNPNLSTTPYQDGTAVYNQGVSGALANPAGPPVTTQDAFLYYDYVIDTAAVLPGYAVGFVKLTENMSPIPRDRVYMNYSYFRNANFFPTRADVNRFMPGFEKTFFDGWSSVEIRTPFAATLGNGQQIVPNVNNSGVSGVTEYRDIQFGNMSAIFKTMIWERETWAITGGVQVMLPTANNTFVNDPISNTQQVFVANEAVHVMPFIGSVWAPNDRFFNQALLQIDRDVNGNLAYVNDQFMPGIQGRQLTQAGRIFYPTFMYLSFGTGYWLYKDNTANFTGFSPIMELHVNQGLSEFCPLKKGSYVLGQSQGMVSVVNAMVGCNFEWGQRSTLTFGYVTPLGGGTDRFFDSEFRAMYNWRFGPQNRLTRAQF